MSKKKEVVHSLIRESRLDECANCSKMDDHSGQKLLTKHSKVDVGREQVLHLHDPVAQPGNLIGMLDLERDKSNGRNLIRQPGRCATLYARLLLSFFRPF